MGWLGQQLSGFRISYPQTIDTSKTTTILGVLTLSSVVIVMGIFSLLSHLHKTDCINLASPTFASNCKSTLLPIGYMVIRPSYDYTITSSVSYTGEMLSCKVRNVDIFVRGVPACNPFVQWNVFIVCNDDIVLKIVQCNTNKLNSDLAYLLEDFIDHTLCSNNSVMAIRYNDNSTTTPGFNGIPHVMYSYSMRNMCTYPNYNLDHKLGYSITAAMISDINHTTIPTTYQCTHCRAILNPWYTVLLAGVTGAASVVSVTNTLVLWGAKYLTTREKTLSEYNINTPGTGIFR